VVGVERYWVGESVVESETVGWEAEKSECAVGYVCGLAFLSL
jgi:hypothetical protein